MNDRTAARATVEQALRSPITDPELAHLEHDGYLDDIHEPDAINRAVAAIRKGRATFGTSPPLLDHVGRAAVKSTTSKGHGPTPLDWHEESLSDAFAAFAGADPGPIQDERTRALAHSLRVAAFRRKVLKNQLVPLDDVGSWIREMARRQPAAKRPKTRLPLLAYGVPSLPHACHEVATPGGTLDQLRKISERLADFFGWGRDQATVFVLTGTTPTLHTIWTSARLADPLEARSRIILTIDPKVTPRELADHYRATRRALFNGRRLRRLSEKHARLAAFNAQQPEDSTVEANREQWNAQCRAWKHPDWRYRAADVNRFKRDCQQALERLVGL